MIITRSPLRISLGGGSTDIRSFSKLYGGFWISAAIDKYVYVTVSRPFQSGIYLKYSEMEKVQKVEEVKHPIIRECLRHMDLNTPQIEITTLADIPAGTGLGSSGSFTVALLKALHVYYKKSISTRKLADLACKIEIDKLKQPIGIQDQYISAFGGINCFHCLNEVKIFPLRITHDTLLDLEDNLLLFFTGFSRSANEILKEQDSKSINLDKEMISNLSEVKQSAYVIQDRLESGRTKDFAEIMNWHWNKKKERSKKMTNPKIEEWYNLALKNGAIGGKLVGAGGGGFLMFYAQDKNLLRQVMSEQGLEEVRFKFDFEGTKCIL